MPSHPQTGFLLPFEYDDIYQNVDRILTEDVDLTLRMVGASVCVSCMACMLCLIFLLATVCQTITFMPPTRNPKLHPTNRSIAQSLSSRFTLRIQPDKPSSKQRLKCRIIRNGTVVMDLAVMNDAVVERGKFLLYALHVYVYLYVYMYACVDKPCRMIRNGTVVMDLAVMNDAVVERGTFHVST